jgi:hypothetical protein
MSHGQSYDQSVKHTYKVRRFRRSMKVLVGRKKRDTTFVRRPDRYFAHVYVNRRLWEAICFLSKTNRLSRMETVHQILEAGLSRILGNAILEDNRRAAALREQGLSAKPTHLVLAFVRWAKRRGYDIGDYFEHDLA